MYGIYIYNCMGCLHLVMAMHTMSLCFVHTFSLMLLCQDGPLRCCPTIDISWATQCRQCLLTSAARKCWTPPIQGGGCRAYSSCTQVAADFGLGARGPRTLTGPLTADLSNAVSGCEKRKIQHQQSRGRSLAPTPATSQIIFSFE